MLLPNKAETADPLLLFPFYFSVLFVVLCSTPFSFKVSVSVTSRCVTECTLPYAFRPLCCYETSGPVYPVTMRDVTEGRICQLRRWETQNIPPFVINCIPLFTFPFRPTVTLLRQTFCKILFAADGVWVWKKCEGKADKRRACFENKIRLNTFWIVPLSIIRSLFTVHSAMVCVIRVCRQLSSRTIWSCSKAVYKPVWHIPLLSVQ